MKDIIIYFRKNIDLFFIILFILTVLIFKILVYNNNNNLNTLQKDYDEIKEKTIFGKKFEKICLVEKDMTMCTDLNKLYFIEQILIKENTIYLTIDLDENNQ